MPDEMDYDGIPVPETLPPSVAEVFARRKRRKDSVRAATQMWAPILEHYREYSEHMVFVPWTDR